MKKQNLSTANPGKLKTSKRLLRLVMSGCMGLGALTAAYSHEKMESWEKGEHEQDIDRILLISVDGLHALDLARYASMHPASTMARLVGMGTTYTSASAAKPSDSFPGLLAIVTGGSPISTGVYYDNSYDRNLCAPGSGCATHGTEVVFDESIDINQDLLDAGGGIDVTKLPLDPKHGNAPVYPHNFLRVNTIFEVAKAAGLRTAWSDKHPAYDIVNGPSGHGVDDLYTPEINNASSPTSSVTLTEGYDDLKVKAILNEIDGMDHAGKKHVGVPAVFGMNFQAVSVGEKLMGYATGAGEPTASLADAFDHTDYSLGLMVKELEKQHLMNSTVIILTAKHGQSPIDPLKHHVVNAKIIPAIVNGVQAGLLAKDTQDDIALLWLTDGSKSPMVAKALRDQAGMADIQEVLEGEGIQLMFPNAKFDSRAPDLVVIPNHGVIYAKPTATKIAEHGGFAFDDVNVPIVLSNPNWKKVIIKTPVQTTQIAPTLLKLLGLNPHKLQAVEMEHIALLPGVRFDD